MKRTVIVPVIKDRSITVSNWIMQAIRDSMGKRNNAQDWDSIIIQSKIKYFETPKVVVDTLLAKNTISYGDYLSKIGTSRHMVTEHNKLLSDLIYASGTSVNMEIIILYEMATQSVIDLVYYDAIKLTSKSNIYFFDCTSLGGSKK